MEMCRNVVRLLVLISYVNGCVTNKIKGIVEAKIRIINFSLKFIMAILTTMSFDR